MATQSFMSKEEVDLKYKEEELRGAGTFGDVKTYCVKKEYENTNLKTRIVAKAIKMCHSTSAAREIKSLKALLNEAHIVKMLGYEEFPFFIYMECLNDDLASYAEKRKFNFSEKELFKVCMDTLRGLISLQKFQIIHRDIKPRNLLVDYNGSDGLNLLYCLIKICDLGGSRPINRVLMDMGKHGELTKDVGTRGYMCPEVTPLLGEKDCSEMYSYKADVWSLATSLIYLCTGGKKPFTEQVLKKLKADINTDEIRDKEIVSIVESVVNEEKFPQLLYLIKLMLKWNEDDRISAEACLTMAQCLQAEGLAATPVIAPQSSQIITTSKSSQIKTTSPPSVIVSTSTSQGVQSVSLPVISTASGSTAVATSSTSQGPMSMSPSPSTNQEIVTICKGQSKEFLNKNCRMFLSMESLNDSITFKAEFTGKEKLEKILQLMKENDIVACGPVVEMHSLEDTHSKQKLNSLKATLSMRHFLNLPEKSKHLNKKMKLLMTSDVHFFVSFVEKENNSFELVKHLDVVSRANSADVDISSFSHWCFAGTNPCEHSFPMNICLLRRIGSPCPHEHAQLHFVARKKAWKEANDDVDLWDNPEQIQEEFENMYKKKKRELAAEELELSLPSCHNEYEVEIGMKSTIDKDAELEWKKCGTFSIHRFISDLNENGVSSAWNLKHEFPKPDCEKASHTQNYPYVRLKFKKVEGTSTCCVKFGSPSELFEDEGSPMFIRDICFNAKERSAKRQPTGIAFVVGNSFQHSKDKNTLESCPINADKFKEYLQQTTDLKYNWHVESENDVTKETFEKLLSRYSSETSLVKEAEAICLYISSHGTYNNSKQYIIFEDDKGKDDAMSVDNIQKKIAGIYKSRGEMKYFVLIFECCRNKNESFDHIKREMDIFSADKVGNTNNVHQNEQVSVLWSTQRGDESRNGLPGRQSTFSEQLLYQLKEQKTKFTDLGVINDNLRTEDGKYCSITSTGGGFDRF